MRDGRVLPSGRWIIISRPLVFIFQIYGDFGGIQFYIQNMKKLSSYMKKKRGKTDYKGRFFSLSCY